MNQTGTLDCGFCERPLAEAEVRIIFVEGQPVSVHAYHVERRPAHVFVASAHDPNRCRLCSREMEGHAA